MNNSMFCYQSQETMGGKGCTRTGMCGKRPDLAAMQDLLVYVTKGLSAVTTQLRKEKVPVDVSVNHMITDSLCATSTDANFDKDAVVAKITNTIRVKDSLVGKLKKRDAVPDAARWSGSVEEYAGKAASKDVGVLSTHDEDIRSFRELVTYGVKGVAAFLYDANALGSEDEEIDGFIQRALAETLDDTLTGGSLLALVMETGRYGVRVMDLLDRAHIKAYGNPEETKVSTGVRGNPGILVAGDNLADLKQILDQTAGSGVDVYTYDDMLPAHYYPAFKKYDNLAGNYGGSWWHQKEDFDSFNGPVVMTSGNIVPPKDSYSGRLFTTGYAGIPGTRHIDGGKGGEKDFSAVIGMAKECTPPSELENGEIIGGFAHDQMSKLADKIVPAVKNGSISKFFVMEGVDGRAKTRSYYTDFAKALPEDAVILTAGSAKYRYNKLSPGEAGGIPRILDAGQISDAYSLVQTALQLKDAFGMDNLNQLPFVYNIAWYDQKSIIVLLSLLYLDVKHIHLGPTMPAFLSPNVANVLTKYFGITGIKTVKEDMESFMGASGNLIQEDMIVGDIVQQYPSLVPVMLGCGLNCIGCGISQMETLAEACMTHGLDVYDIMDILNDQLAREGKA